MNYESDLRIDETALDLEWLEQPSLFMKYARHLANARKILDEEKQSLDVKRAELDRNIRENPDKFGIEKITEGAISSAILTSLEYKTAYQKFLDVKYEVDMASNAIQAFNQRKDALENLVKLYGQQYFAGPKMPRDLHWEREEKQKGANLTVSRLTRKK